MRLKVKRKREKAFIVHLRVRVKEKRRKDFLDKRKGRAHH